MVDETWGTASHPHRAEPLHITFVVDVSGSMATGGKIQSLNTAVEEALPSLRTAVSEAVGVEAFVQVLAFGSSPRWVVSPPRPLPDFWWPELHAEPRGLTELGSALGLLVDSFRDDGTDLPPPLILLTDGMPTDTIAPTFEEALVRLDEHPFGRAGSRVAVAIGRDADRETLEAFVRSTSGAVLTAQDPHQLAAQIRLAGVTIIKSATELAP